MAFWTGVERGMAKSAASALADEELELRKVSSERQGKIYDLQEIDTKLSLAEKMSKFSNLSPNNSGFSKTSSAFKTNKKDNNENSYQQNMAILKKTFKLSDEVVAKIFEEGGPEAVASITSLAYDTEKKLAGGDFVGNPTISSLIGSAIDGRIVTESSVEPIDFNAFADMVEPELLEELQGISESMQGQTFPEVTFSVPELRKTISLSDLNQVYAGFGRDLTGQANFEIEKLNNISGDNDVDTAVQQWAANRKAEIRRAVDSIGSGNYGPILGYYGSTYFEKVESQRKGFTQEMIPDFYRDMSNRESSIMDVETPEFFNQLLGAGLIPKGQMVRYELSDANITKLRMENGNEYVDRLLENGRVITEVATRGY